jgi:hypothetical protein
MARLPDLLDEELDLVRRNSEAVSCPLGATGTGDHPVDADQFPVQIDQRSAAGARVDRGIGLHHIAQHVTIQNPTNHY